MHAHTEESHPLCPLMFFPGFLYPLLLVFDLLLLPLALVLASVLDDFVSLEDRRGNLVNNAGEIKFSA